MNERYRSLRVQAVERDANGHVVHAIVQSAISVIGGGGGPQGLLQGRQRHLAARSRVECIDAMEKLEYHGTYTGDIANECSRTRLQGENMHTPVLSFVFHGNATTPARDGTETQADRRNGALPKFNVWGTASLSKNRSCWAWPGARRWLLRPAEGRREDNAAAVISKLEVSSFIAKGRLI